MKNRPFIYLTNKLKDTHLKELLMGSSIDSVFRITGKVKGFMPTLLSTRNSGLWSMGIFAFSFAVLTVFFFVIGGLGFLIPLLGYCYKK